MSKRQLVGINVLLLWVFWFHKNFASANEQAGFCRTLEFIPPLDAHALVNHVIKTIYLERQEACRVACYLDNDCLSYNFGRVQDGHFICQLSDSDHVQHPEDLKKSSGFIYRGTENACSRNLCSAAHGKCKIDPKDNTYYCKCEDGFVGKYCKEVIWVKINTVPVCFGTRDDRHGTFTITQAGSIGALKLVHLHGIVVCHPWSTRSFWGCEVPVYLDKTLMTIVTHSNQRSLLIPRRNTTQMGVSNQNCATELTYKLDGFNDTSPEIVFNTTSDPIQVSLHQEFWVWFGQDMADCSESNNSGESCVDVYGWYIP